MRPFCHVQLAGEHACPRSCWTVALLVRKAIKSRKLLVEREALLDEITALFEG